MSLIAPYILFPSGGGGGFHPSDVTGLVALYHLNDLTGVYQESSQTTPAAVNQPVGYFPDREGTNHMTASSTARPTLRQDGDGDYYLEVTGGQVMNMATSAAVAAGTLISAGYQDSSIAAEKGYVTNESDQASDVDYAFTTATASTWATAQAAGGSLADGTHIWQNQTQTATITQDTKVVWAADGTSHPGTLQFPDGLQFFLDRSNGGRYWIGRFYNLAIYSGVLSTGDRNNVEDWCAASASITF